MLKFAVDMGVPHMLATSLLSPSLTRPRQLFGLMLVVVDAGAHHQPPAEVSTYHRSG